jgi:hypothetical protein
VGARPEVAWRTERVARAVLDGGAPLTALLVAWQLASARVSAAIRTAANATALWTARLHVQDACAVVRHPTVCV